MQAWCYDCAVPGKHLLVPRPSTLFDCIEFSDDVSCIDLLYGLAFLLMDLGLLGRGDHANAAFNAYLDITQETTGLRTLPRSWRCGQRPAAMP